jgi:acyl carrier protein
MLSITDSISCSNVNTPSTFTTTEDSSMKAATVAVVQDRNCIPVKATTTIVQDPNSITVKATTLISSQTGIEPSELTDETRFCDIGVDSLMSLVFAEGFRNDLGVTVNSSLFLEYPSWGL